MKNENTAITTLAITALLLLLAIIFVPTPAGAEVSIKDGDYLIATYPVSGAGGDGLFIADTRAGLMSVFVYDNNAKQLQLRAVRRIDDGFRIRQ